MILVAFLLCVSVSLTVAAPAYGKDGVYTGYASYIPPKNQLQNSIGRYSEDSIHASAGSPDIVRRPVKKLAPAPQREYETPTNLGHQAPQHGYGSNNLDHDISAAPYAKASLYGQESAGYKIADIYQNQQIDSHENKEHDYKDDYVSDPQPYEYGYALKDEYGNAQHRKESSDGRGKVEGSYGFTDEHGNYRSVQYVADKEGFRASIKTNEPGTESQNPADVHLESEQSKN